MCSMTVTWSIRDRPTSLRLTKRADNRLPAPVPKNGRRLSSARPFRIEAVLRAHRGDDAEVFAASDEAHRGASDMAARHIGLDDVSLQAVIGRIGAAGFHRRTIIDRALGHDCREL